MKQINLFTANVPYIRWRAVRFPLDVVAHVAEGCLYVADWAAGGERGGRVWRVYPDGLVDPFIDDVEQPRKLSLTADRLLIVSRDRLVVRRLPHGEVTSVVALPVAEAQHAVELTAAAAADDDDDDGRRRRATYVVGHGASSDVPHRVSVVEVSPGPGGGGTAVVVRSYGGRGPGELSWPTHVSLAAGDGRVVVADCDNDRVVMLDARLRLERVALSGDDDDAMRTPRRLCYVDDRGLLLVGIDAGCVDVYRIK